MGGCVHDPRTFLGLYLKNRINASMNINDRRVAEDVLGVLRGHLARLQFLPRDSSARLVDVGEYVVAVNETSVNRCIRRFARSMIRFILFLYEVHPAVSAAMLISSRRVPLLRGLCRDPVALVVGIDHDSDKLFIHPLPPLQSLLVSLSESLDEKILRLAMGFHLHRWEPGAGEPSDGVRVRLQGDLAVEYAASFKGPSEALEAAAHYEAMNRLAREGISEALEALREASRALAPIDVDLLDTAGERVLEEWLSSHGAPKALKLYLASMPDRVAEGWRDLQLYPVERLVDAQLETPRDYRSCRMSRWEKLTGSPDCFYLALRSVPNLDLSLRMTLEKEQPVLLHVPDRSVKAAAAAYAAQKGSTTGTAFEIREPGRVAIELGNHFIEAEEAIVVSSGLAVLAHGASRIVEALEDLTDIFLSLKLNEIEQDITRNKSMPASIVEPLLSVFAMDWSNYVIVLPRPQRITAWHREHGEATMSIRGPATLMPGGLKSRMHAGFTSGARDRLRESPFFLLV